MIRPPSATKDKCEGCNKFILMHNKIMSCRKCNKTVHAQCAMNLFDYDQVRDYWCCNECISSSPPRYNPFNNILYDRHDPIHLSDFEDVMEIKKILDSCNTYNHRKFKRLIDLNKGDGQNITALFNNIDGNSTNFDNFVTEIACYNHSFSFVGIAETNINAEGKDLYRMPGYVSEYGDKFKGKSKGTGVGIYIKQDFIYTRIDALCQCTWSPFLFP